MPKNEDGEFELILGNRQLLGMFFIVVMLFGVFFVMGYIVGQNSSGPGRADVASAKKPDVKAATGDGSDQQPDQPASARASETAAPAETAPQQPVEITRAEPAPAKPAAPKPAPKAEPKEPKAAAKPEPKPVSQQPVAGQRYLQLAAIDKDHADGLVDLLREKGFSALDVAVPENPKVYRVLVGPVKDGDMGKLRSDLQSKSFPGNAGMAKVF